MHANLIRAGESLDDLILGGLKIIQPIKGYRFSIDAVLLAHFADLHGVKKVIDLGTGNGIIPLLLSHRDPGIDILGIELQPAMADRAGRSVQLNNLQHRIDILQADIRKLKEKLPGGSAELVLSNPPFWKRGEGHVNQNHEKSIARHELEITLKELAEGAVHLLAPQGVLAIIHRVERLNEIADVFGHFGLSLSRVRKVQSYAERPARQVLVEARFGRQETVLIPPLIMYSKLNCYGDELRHLYGEA